MKLSLMKNEYGFNQLRWVAKGLTTKKSDIQKYVTRIYKDGNRFVATNGVRIHLFESGDWEHIEDGFYEVVKNTQSVIVLLLDCEKEDATYPDIEETIKIKYSFPQDTFEVGLGRGDEVSKSFTSVIRNMVGENDEEANNTLNFEFLKDVLSINETFSVYHKDESEPICFKAKGDELFAIIMPIRN